MKPYSSARKEAPGRGVLLNANELPWPLLDDTAPGLNRYPEPQPAELVARLAGLYGVHEDSLLVTRGSDEGIDLLTRVFCRAGQDAILQCPPTFGMYRIAAQTQGADIVSVPRDPADFHLDESAVLDALLTDSRIRLVFLSSPDNPTGGVVATAFLQRLLEAARGHAVVVIDEAYAEFCNQPSACGLIGEFENLVVLRTMSKAWGAAGLRCGAVLAQPSLIALLRRVIAPYPLPTPVSALALRLLAADAMERQRALLVAVAQNKKLLLRTLEGRPFVQHIFPGKANFVLLRANDAAGLLDFCAARGVIVRGFPADPLLTDCLRITVGSEEEIRMLAAVLDEWEART